MNKRISFVLCAMALVCSMYVFAYDVRDRDDVNPFDRPLMNHYVSGLDRACDVVTVGFLAVPVFLVAVPSMKKDFVWDKGGVRSAVTLSLIYTESLITSYVTKEILKNCITRERPYMYFSGAPKGDISNGDYRDSFPSGHTTLAFCAASFMSVSYCKLFPASRLKPLVVAGSFGLAAGIGAARIASGCHFATDVLVGAAIGTVCGGIFPLLQLNERSVGFAFRGNGFDVSMKL